MNESQHGLLWRTVALGTMLLLYANLADLLVVVGGVHRVLYDLASLVLLLALGGWLVLSRELASLGVHRQNLARSIMWGTVLGLGLATPPLVFFAFPVLLAGPVHYPSIAEMTTMGLLWELLVRVPIVTVLLQELVFRGLLQRQFTLSLGSWRGILVTNAFFSAWHLVIAWDAVSQQQVALSFLPSWVFHFLGYVGALAVVWAGGVVLSLLRWRTDNLAGPVVTHWLVVVLMTMMLYAQ